MRDAVNVLVEKKSGFCCVFSGSDDTGYKYIIGRKGGDAREAGKLLSQNSVRGGGQPQMIQGRSGHRGKNCWSCLKLENFKKQENNVLFMFHRSVAFTFYITIAKYISGGVYGFSTGLFMGIGNAAYQVEGAYNEDRARVSGIIFLIRR